VRAGRPISRIALAYEAGRDGFWLARWLIARGIEAHVIHSASVAVSRERKRAKTDRLDAAMLMRVFLGWLRGERGHCGMVAIPMTEEEDARRPSRARASGRSANCGGHGPAGEHHRGIPARHARLELVREQINSIEKTSCPRPQAPAQACSSTILADLPAPKCQSASNFDPFARITQRPPSGFASHCSRTCSLHSSTVSQR
jgi:hypothetical protein